MIHSTTTHSFGINTKTSDPLSGVRSIARAFCYPQGEWFSLTLGNNKDDVHITWKEWDELSENVKQLREVSRMELILSAQGTPEPQKPVETKGEGE
jgi:hypothetical protein